MTLRGAFISEHYKPRIGGISTYVDSFVSAIANTMESAYLLVPAEGGKGTTDICKTDNTWVVRIGVGVSLHVNISAHTRIYFLTEVNAWLERNIVELRLNAVHVIFGMYAMRYLDLDRLPVSVGRTCMVHNVPPAECDGSWADDNFHYRLKDDLRKLMIGVINRRRIRHNKWDTIFVPSNHVRNQLMKFDPDLDVRVVSHGIGSVTVYNDPKLALDGYKVITVSRITPHKNQHIIPGILELLNEVGFKVRWTIVGPRQHNRYASHIEELRDNMTDPDRMIIKYAVNDEELKNLYKSSDLYVHTSREEGFGLTILEAAASGLPVIGMDTGAISEIVRNWFGCVVTGSIESFSLAIIEMIQSTITREELERESVKLADSFSWAKHAASVASVMQAKISERVG